MTQFFRKLFRMQEPQRPLPMGRTEYETWSKRIIEGAQVPGLTEESANFALMSMLLHLPSTQSFHTDSFFTHGLRKAAVNQTAYTLMAELDQKQKARIAAEKAAATPKTALAIVPDAPASASDNSDVPGTPATEKGV